MARVKQVPTKRVISKSGRQSLHKVSFTGTKTSSVTGTAEVKKARPHRYRPGTVARREIRKYQKSYKLLIPKRPFRELLKEVLHELKLVATKPIGILTSRFQESAVEAIHEAAEAYMVEVFEDSYLLACHAKRKTVQVKDIQTAFQMHRQTQQPPQWHPTLSYHFCPITNRRFVFLH